MESAVNTLFSEISPEKSNSDIYTETVETYRLRKAVLTRLISIEVNRSGFLWWQDVELMEIFKTLFKSGIIMLPLDPVERLRWIALLCVEISNFEEFDCGNIVLLIDFFPDELIEVFKEFYPTENVDGVRKIRKQLVDQGWDAVFGW